MNHASTATAMDATEFRERGYQIIDFVAGYLENIRKYPVFPSVQPGYMRKLIPADPPEKPEKWDDIIGDVDRVLMPGITHWQSPYFHAYFPAITSYPCILADLVCGGLNNVGFTWASSPACTELETTMMDWVGKMLDLPEEFLHDGKGDRMGGGVIQPSISESTLVCMLAARAEAIRKFKEKHADAEDGMIISKLVAYGSDQTHSHFEKDTLIAAVKMNLIETDIDDEFALTGKKLKAAVEKDKKAGLIPFFVCATLGTTGVCTFDKLTELGPICKEEGMWLHVDAAYAGAFFVCPEFRSRFGMGIELADSFVFNAAKAFLITYECSCLWIKDCTYFFRAFNVEPLYLKHENSGHAIDYMHWQLQLSRRFRSLKLWFAIRSYGVEGFRHHLREHDRLGGVIESLVRLDNRFEIPARRRLGLCVFRFKDAENEKTELLLKRINQTGKLHCVPCMVKDKFVIRFCVNSPATTDSDIKRDWLIIQETATKVDEEYASGQRPQLRFSVYDPAVQGNVQGNRRASLAATADALGWSATMEDKEGSKATTPRRDPRSG